MDLCGSCRFPDTEVMTQILRISAIAAIAACLCMIPAAARATGGSATTRDAQHDFDWDIGIWKTHMRRRLHPLTHSNAWVDYDGTDTIRKVWGGRANMGEIEISGSAGHLEILNLRLFDPDTNQWSFNIANSAVGTIGIPAVGGFKDGQAAFFDREPYKGKPIVVRFTITGITKTTARFEQSFSPDGGKTWEVNLIVDETLLSSRA
jgi:hypothetical protein